MTNASLNDSYGARFVYADRNDIAYDNSTDSNYGITQDAAEDMEVSILSAFPNFSPTTIIYQPDGTVMIEQENDDMPQDIVYLSRDMALELVGALNVFIRATAA